MIVPNAADPAVGFGASINLVAMGHNSRMEAYLGYAYAAAGRARDARGVLKALEVHCVGTGIPGRHPQGGTLT